MTTHPRCTCDTPLAEAVMGRPVAHELHCAVRGHLDTDRIEQFRNFLSWGAIPARPTTVEPRLPVAAWGYAFGLTPYCPPCGEL